MALRSCGARFSVPLPASAGSRAGRAVLGRRRRTEVRRCTLKRAPQGSRDDVLDTLVALRQPEHEVPDDIPLDLGRSGFDRVSAASQIPIGPLPVVESLCRPMIELTIGPLNLHRDLLESLVQLAPEDLLDRPLRPR